jgi:hypothetical protein
MWCSWCSMKSRSEWLLWFALWVLGAWILVHLQYVPSNTFMGYWKDGRAHAARGTGFMWFRADSVGVLYNLDTNHYRWFE